MNATDLANSFGFITEAQLMQLAGITLTTAARWRALHKGPSHVVVGTVILYSRSAVQEWLDGLLIHKEALSSTTGSKRISRAHLL